ncbi:hypothetical protein GCM10025878_14220 [Leuconostoc gasicomitatum]|uniref:hypothetical protein n=1 Tax=Leuconostoc gasicomitatum TaxID=115778 RepID=UPI0001DB580C|nr:hypothetical protein [Leuconostoc gasicomitatum]GMA06351.1 hypothetical protein GCM10025878_14220 [Leuconostoc gasicomitatum]CBL92251.1 conserved hypothetical protein [Leuconostoc gasicomitatum LMG 18811]
MTESKELEFVSNQAIQAAGEAIQEVNDSTFLVSSDGVTEFRPNNNAKIPISITTLGGINKAIESHILGRSAVSVNVNSPEDVVIYGKINEFGNREVLAETKLRFESFDFDHSHKREEMIVALQALFSKTPDRDILLKFISNVKDSNESSFTDDGTTQIAKASTGPASLANVKVPNPVILKPFRTFTEVDQPESAFIFRMNNIDSFSLHEADGGFWKQSAINNIGEHLETIIDGKVPVIY